MLILIALLTLTGLLLVGLTILVMRIPPLLMISAGLSGLTVYPAALHAGASIPRAVVASAIGAIALALLIDFAWSFLRSRND